MTKISEKLIISRNYCFKLFSNDLTKMAQALVSVKLLQTLTDVGLSENQARVYLASRSLGPAKAADIAKQADIKRTTVYPVIESLERLGLMTVLMKGFKKLYHAEAPERLATLVELRQQKLKNSLADLNTLGATDDSNHTIKHLESLDAIKHVYNSMIEDIKPKERYMIFASPQELYDLDPEFFEDFFIRRGKLDINIRALLQDSPVGRRYRDEGGEIYNVTTKLFPNTVKFTANLVITPQRLLIHQLLSPTWAIVIENPQIIKTHQELFESFWASIPERETKN